MSSDIIVKGKKRNVYSKRRFKSLFESTDVSDLKRLHFEVDEDTTLMLEVEKVEDNGQDTEGPVDMVQERETEG